MRTHRIVLSIAMAIACTAAESPAWSQENQGTPEQQMACTPDVFRLCGEMIPDAGRITACLRQKTPLLSGPCRAVFEPAVTVNVPQQLPPRARNNRQKPQDIRPKIYEDDDQ